MAVLMQREVNATDRSLDSVVAGLNLPEVFQSYSNADGSVATHVQCADVIEKNDSNDAFFIIGRADRGSHDHFRATRLIYDRSTKLIELSTKNSRSFCQRAGSETGKVEYDTRRFAARMGVNNVKWFDFRH